MGLRALNGRVSSVPVQAGQFIGGTHLAGVVSGAAGVVPDGLLAASETTTRNHFGARGKTVLMDRSCPIGRRAWDARGCGRWKGIGS